MKILFHLKGGQKEELILNLIFPNYPDHSNGENGNEDKEKETAETVSQSRGGSYTPAMVRTKGLEPPWLPTGT